MELETILSKTQEKMDKAISTLKKDFSGIRTGRANVGLLDRIKVNVYNQLMDISSLGSINVSDSSTLTVSVWDSNNVNAVESAIIKSDLGLNPRTEGNKLFITIPQLTSERRKEYIKLAAKKSEEIKISIRNIRRESNDEIKKLEKEKLISEDEAKEKLDHIQKMTDNYIKTVTEVLALKQKDLEKV